MTTHGPEFNPAMRPDEPLTPFDVTRSSEKAGMVKLLVGAAILLALALIVLKIYHPDGTRDRNDPPLITAENTPFKIVPEDPGGMQTPDQDKEVFDVMSGSEPSTDVITLPQPEEPVERPTILDRQTPAIETDSDSAPSTPVVTPSTPAREPEVVDTTPAPTPAPQPVATGQSNWIVQVASLRSQSEAERTYSAIQARHASIIGQYGSDIARVDLGDKGIYYRARVAGFVSKDEADQTCNRLKAAGQSCFVTRR